MTNNNEEMSSVVSTVPKDQTIAVILPLYGFFRDLTSPELNLEVLKSVLSRLRSYNNKVYFLFPSEPPRLPDDIKNYLLGQQLGGNAVGVEVDPFSTYSDYVNEGISFALEETDSRFLIVVNPWVAIRPGSIDTMVSLLNRPDVAVCSGTDLRKMNISDQEADTYVFNPPRDFTGLDINFFGLTRPVAESVKIDTQYKTVSFLSRDLYENLSRMGFPSMLTQHIPFYSFPVTWKDLEDPGDFQEDHDLFLQKWRFETPDIREDNR